MKYKKDMQNTDMNDFIPIEKCAYCGSTDIGYTTAPPNHIAAICKTCGKFNQYVTQVTSDNWARLVKEKYAYTCMHCGKKLTPRQADAHHLLPTWFMPHLKTTIENGVCLCKECHRQLHGTGGTIKEDTT